MSSVKTLAGRKCPALNVEWRCGSCGDVKHCQHCEVCYGTRALLAGLWKPCGCKGTTWRGRSLHSEAHKFSDSCTCCRDTCGGYGWILKQKAAEQRQVMEDWALEQDWNFEIVRYRLAIRTRVGGVLATVWWKDMELAEAWAKAILQALEYLGVESTHHA